MADDLGYKYGQKDEKKVIFTDLIILALPKKVCLSYMLMVDLTWLRAARKLELK